VVLSLFLHRLGDDRSVTKPPKIFLVAHLRMKDRKKTRRNTIILNENEGVQEEKSDQWCFFNFYN